MSNLVGNPEDRFSRVAAYLILWFALPFGKMFSYVRMKPWIPG